jgi:RNA polymerase sigma-70 factor (ECF subfamily)
VQQRGLTVDLTDQQIAVRAGTGDVAAYVQLVERYRAPLISYVYGLTSRREEAEELAQEAFCRVWEKLPTLRDRSKLVGWLYRIARNLAVSAARRPRATALVSDPVEPPRPRCSGSLLAVHRALGELPEPQRIIIALRHFSGLSPDEIATVLALPAGTVRSRLSRAYDKLRPILAKHLEE